MRRHPSNGVVHTCALTHALLNRHAAGTNLSFSDAEWELLRRALAAYEEEPLCICYNCGIADYAQRMHKITIPCAGANHHG